MSTRLQTYERLREVETHLQSGRGMMRTGEIELLANVAKRREVTAYVEFGCGPCHALQEVRKVCGDSIALFGFEQAFVPESVIRPIHAMIYQMSVLSTSAPSLNDSTLAVCRAIRACTGKTLWFTDNGHKVAELRGVVSVARVGDIIATHDYTTEVVDDSIPFLCTDNYGVISELEQEIEDHGYLLRFWEKVQ